MKLLATLAAWYRAERIQWFDRERLRAIQERKLRRLVLHAYHHVPFYRNLFDRVCIEPQSIRTLEDLERIPVTSKKQLQTAGSEATTSLAYRPESLTSARTSGSSGRPFTVQFDRKFLDARRAGFLRALRCAGYKPGSRLMLITSVRDKQSPSWSGWRYVPFYEPPERMISFLNDFQPRILYGWVTPLRRLAIHILQTGTHVHSIRSIVTTAETLNSDVRHLLAEAFNSDVFEIYGSTETGLVSWECYEHDHHLSEDTVIAEFRSYAQSNDDYRLIVTNLELTAMPFIRFDTGDMAVPGHDGQCSCGRWLRRIGPIEGRIVDCVRLRDGQIVSPYQLTLALEDIPGIERYQIVQNDYEKFTVRYEGTSNDAECIGRPVRCAIQGVLGENVEVQVEKVGDLDPETGRKFRVVHSKLPAESQP